MQRLAAVETLGNATVVASDKTGTLTENRLRVAAVAPAGGKTEMDVLAGAAFASTATLVIDEDGGARIAGDPLEEQSSSPDGIAAWSDRSCLATVPSRPNRALRRRAQTDDGGVRTPPRAPYCTKVLRR